MKRENKDFEDFVEESCKNETYSKINGRLEPCQIEVIVYDDANPKWGNNFMSIGIQGDTRNARIFVGLDLDVVEELISALSKCRDKIRENERMED